MKEDKNLQQMKDIKSLQQMHADGRINRRDFMKAVGALGITISVAGSLLKATEAMAKTPRKGGSVRMASNLHGPDDQMDPIVMTSNIDYTRAHTAYNGLVQMRENMQLKPELAEEFTPNSDATVWTFKLQKGVKFHDGSNFSADDVIWSMNRHLGEKTTSVIKGFFSQVKEWKKIDSHTVKAILNSPDSDLQAKLSEKQAKIVKQGTTDFKKGNGTGPYRVTSFEPGTKSLHVRNEDYWRETANFDAIEITAITDPQARVNALIAGDMHLISDVDAKMIKLIESSNGVHINSTKSGRYGGICCLKNTAPGKNDDLVKGFQYIQDRERIVRSILKGKGEVGNDHPISTAYGADHCYELPVRQYDPDKAKWHLNRSGYSSAELYVAEVATGIGDSCLLMQNNLSKIGFDLKIKKVPTDGYWGAVWMKEPLNVVSWNMRPTANSMLDIQFGPGRAWNDTFWNNERMGQLLKMNLAETDPKMRHEMFCEMQALINMFSGMVVAYHTNVNDGVSDKIQGIPVNPLGSIGGCTWPEFAWMEA